MNARRRTKLLSIDADAKTSKGIAGGWLTGVCYLEPWRSDSDPLNLCPASTEGCRLGCLYRAGRAAISATINDARRARRALYVSDRAAFMAKLVAEVEALERVAYRRKLRPCVRLNGTSDIDYTVAHPVTRGGFAFESIFAAFPHVRFYDYTKRPAALRRPVPPNYDLTFSRSETTRPNRIRDLLGAGRRTAVVFAVDRSKPLPTSWENMPVIDGDSTDLRFLDPAVIVGLRAKGPARRDPTAFVVRS